jgi:hypothetical protein
MRTKSSNTEGKSEYTIYIRTPRSEQRLPLKSNHRRLIIVYSAELPTRLVEQVTKMYDRAFLAIIKTHHLSTGQHRAKKEAHKKGPVSHIIVVV